MKKPVALLFLFLILLPALVWASPPVPFSGKVAIDGVNYNGQAKFSFAIRDQAGTVHWRNGATANDAINVNVANGRYVVLLAGQGMNPLPASLFANHDELYLRVFFDKGDGQGLRHLAPDQRITAVPYAKVADIAKSVENSSITTAQLNEQILKYLKPEIRVVPEPRPIYAGQKVTFSYTVEGRFLNYQWKRNNQVIAGETKSSLVITDTNASLHDGNYTFVASNDFGTAEEVFTVEVNASDNLFSGLVGLWTFDDNTSKDTSGNGFDGVASSPDIYSLDTPKGWGTSIDLSGDQYVTVSDDGNQSSFDIVGSCSISLWAKGVPTSNYKSYVSKFGSASNGPGWSLRRHNSVNVCFTLRGMDGYNKEDFSFAQNLDDNQWHHLAATHGNDISIIYIDAEQKATQNRSGSVSATGSQLVFGAVDNSNNSSNGPIVSSFSNVSLDNIRIYNRVLTAAEINNLFLSGL